MLLNLLDNAIRHTPAGGLVRTTISQKSDAITIAIEDQGPGIPPADRERIFERFVRLHQGTDGAGLGLPLARWIAEAHGGSLTLEASGATGSRFSVRLPKNYRLECLGVPEAPSRVTCHQWFMCRSLASHRVCSKPNHTDAHGADTLQLSLRDCPRSGHSSCHIRAATSARANAHRAERSRPQHGGRLRRLSPSTMNMGDSRYRRWCGRSCVPV